MLAAEPERLKPYDYPQANDPKLVKPFTEAKWAKDMGIPGSVEGFELEEEDSKAMKKIHPEGEEAALEVSHPPFFSRLLSVQPGRENERLTGSLSFLLCDWICVRS